MARARNIAVSFGRGLFFVDVPTTGTTTDVIAAVAGIEDIVNSSLAPQPLGLSQEYKGPPLAGDASVADLPDRVYVVPGVCVEGEAKIEGEGKTEDDAVPVTASSTSTAAKLV